MKRTAEDPIELETECHKTQKRDITSDAATTASKLSNPPESREKEEIVTLAGDSTEIDDEVLKLTCPIVCVYFLSFSSLILCLVIVFFVFCSYRH